MNSDGAARIAGRPGSRRLTPGVVAVSVLALVALAAAACGDGEPAQVAPPPAAPAPPPAAADAGPNALPAVTVTDVVSEERLVLSSLAPADRPILVWFWAPH